MSFLHELQLAGLTSAIMHASKILPRTRIEDQHWEMALDLIYDRSPSSPVVLSDGTETDDPLAIFSDAFAGQTVAAEVEVETDLPLEDRLRKQLIDGSRKGGFECLIDLAARVHPSRYHQFAFAGCHAGSRRIVRCREDATALCSQEC